MNTQIVIPTVAVFFGVASLIAALYSMNKYRRLLFFTEINSDQIDSIERKLFKQEQLLEESQNLVVEQSHRLARFEKKAPRRQKQKETFLDEKIVKRPAKRNIKERRRQVLTLAKRGQDTETIATTLGMLRGEVELIVNLNHGAAKAANYA